MFIKRWKHILVDEYQDTNIPQYEIIRALYPRRKGVEVVGTKNQNMNDEGVSKMHEEVDSRSLFVVGDRNQAIYSWRGARPTNIDLLTKDYSVQEFRLLENYRSTTPIITVANSILGFKGSESIDSNPLVEPVRILKCYNDEMQANCVASITKSLCQSNGRPIHSIAIMYRTNAQSRDLESALINKGIKYRIINGIKFYNRKEIKDIISFLTLLINPRDKVSANRAMSDPAEGIGESTRTFFFEWVERSEKEAISKGMVPPNLVDHLQFIVSMADENNLNTNLSAERNISDINIPKRFLKPLLLFSKNFMELISDSNNLSISKLILKIERMFINKEYIEKNTKSKVEADDKIENIAELVKSSLRYDSDQGALPSGKLLLFLEETALLITDESTAPDDPSNNLNTVDLMTIHASKGLEFHTVFLTGVEEGCLPLMNSHFSHQDLKHTKDSDEIAEERRLAFVAVTRAEKILFITLRSNTLKFTANGASMVKTRPSRFLFPIDDIIDKKIVLNSIWK